MNKKHTPGPWKMLPDSKNKFWAIHSRSSEASGRIICPVKIEEEANARLIAAAPEMYEALKEIAQNCQCDLEKGHAPKCRALRMLLERAEGNEK